MPLFALQARISRLLIKAMAFGIPGVETYQVHLCTSIYLFCITVYSHINRNWLLMCMLLVYDSSVLPQGYKPQLYPDLEPGGAALLGAWFWLNVQHLGQCPPASIANLIKVIITLLISL